MGTLTAVLERAGLRVEARSLHLAFMEHCRSVAPSIDLDDYHRIGRHHADHYAVVYPVEETALGDLAHWFTYAYADGRDPEQYIGPIRRLVDEWNDGYATGFRSLAYRRGPDFLRISDRRPNLPARDYTLGEREAFIYLTCEDGATPAEIGRVLVAEGADDVSEDEIREFLDGLVASRLVYRERDRYLALALPPRPRDP